MAELMHFNIPGAFNEGYDRGTGLRQKSRLAELASQAYGAAPDQQRGFVQQAIANDPATGLQLGQSLQGDQDARTKSLVNRARFLVNAPEAQRPALYASMVPELQQMGLSQLPPQYDETVAQTAQALVQAYGGIGGASGVQSTYVDAQGNRVAIMRDGSTQILGQNDAGMSQQTINVPGPDGRPAQYTFDKRTGNYVPAQLAGGQQPAQAPSGVYIDPSLPPEVQQQIAQAEAAGQQPPSQMYFAGGQGGASPFVGRRPEDEAAAVEAAKLSVQLSALPAELRMRVESELQKQQGSAQIDAGTEQQKKQIERNTVFAQYQAAVNGLKSGLSNATTGPVAGRLPAVTANQQIAEGAVAALAPVLKQLFRAAGEGTFTDRDQQLLLDMVPTRTDLPAAREAKLQNIDNIVRAKLGQGGIYGAAPADGPTGNGGNGGATQPATGSVLRYNPETGDFE